MQRNLAANRAITTNLITGLSKNLAVTPMKREILQAVASAVSQERSLELVLKCIVEGLLRSGGIALARVWLVRTAGDSCERCREYADGAGKVPPLHLIASAGRPISRAHHREDWSRLDGQFHWGGRKVIQVGATAKPILIKATLDDHKWVEKPEWATQERIRSFAAQPLLYRGEVLGVVAVFSRVLFQAVQFEWLGIFAAAAATAIANARAFDEIDRLRQRLESENAYLRQEVQNAAGGIEILGSSAGIRRVLEQIEMVAPTDAPVLILGETGVGKELVARAIHENSPQRERSLIKLNCSTIPRELFESELFGHIKGAFSGAVTDRIGRFQLANGGTLFLDEIGDLPPEMQPKLLRVLQDGKFEPVGSDRTRHAEVRIIAATNHDLNSLVREGRFRADLYYRLSVFPLEVPPLRERRDDIPLLAAHFLETACKRFNRTALQLSASQLLQLRNYDWPGNVRELQNVIERAVIASRLGSLKLDLPGSAQSGSPASVTTPSAPQETAEVIPDKEMNLRVRENMIAALQLSSGRIYGRGGAAELLGLRPSTLNTRIKKLGLK
jgi:transcriptional regulator with GAF, ATPase, and Fis domain